MSVNILRIDSSIFGGQGVSQPLADALVQQLSSQVEVADVVTHDFAQEEIPHFSANTIDAIGQGKAELADRYIEEIQNADIVILGVPMYNFGIPSSLKAWFDHIARAQVTFKYTENGPEGLLTHKQVYVITTRGGIYKDSELDTEVPYLRTMLGFLGLNDVDFIYAEGLNMQGQREQGIEDAHNTIRAISYTPKTEVTE